MEKKAGRAVESDGAPPSMRGSAWAEGLSGGHSWTEPSIEGLR